MTSVIRGERGHEFFVPLASGGIIPKPQRKGPRMAEVGTATVKVVADTSGLKADLARQLRELADEMDPPKTEGAIVEIIERTDIPDPSVIVPNEVRINGASLYASADDPVVVHEVSSSAQDVVRVTLTLLAKRVTIGAQPK
jgi:hypothetical protein